MTGVRACAFCAMHNHASCLIESSRFGVCACGERGHNPDVETAARMRAYERPDQAALPVEQRASLWHRADERQGGHA